MLTRVHTSISLSTSTDTGISGSRKWRRTSYSGGGAGSSILRDVEWLFDVQ